MNHTNKYFRSVLGFIMMIILSTSSVLAADVTVKLTEDDGTTLLTGGTLKYYDSGWHTAANNGDGTFTASVSGTNIKYKMYYNNGIQYKTVSSTVNPVIFKTVAVDVNLEDNTGGTLTGGKFKFYSHGWSSTKTANSIVNLLPGTYKFKMYYNNGIQYQSGVAISAANDEVTFKTVAVTVELIEKGTTTQLTGGKFKFYSHGWSSTKTANSIVNLLPGTYKFKMYYNNGIEYKSGVAIAHPSPNTVSFKAVKVDVSLKNGTTTLSGGKYKYYQHGWSSMKTDAYVLLLPGTYKFKMYYNHGIQYKNITVANPTNTTVAFNTIQVNVKLLDASNNPLTGGKFKFYKHGWSSKIDANTSINLLPGTYKFKMYYNHGIQYKNGVVIAAPSPQDVTFQTIGTTVYLKDSDGSTLSGGKFKFYKHGWSSKKTANSTIQLLPGTYKFKMYYNHGIQYKKNVAINSTNNTVTFTTVTVDVALEDCSGNDLNNGKFKFYKHGWSSKKDANNDIELLPGTYKFKMYYNYGIQYQNGVNVGTGTDYKVTFTATQVNYMYSGTVKFYQHGWGNYVHGMYLLPGTYKFKFGNYYLNNHTISGCQVSANVHLFKTLKANGQPLPNIEISRNDYSNHYKRVGYTNSNGILFVMDQPGGNQKFRARKHHTAQYLVRSPGQTVFQTAEFIGHVLHTDGSDFAGIEVEYNDYSNHYMDFSPKYTGSNGKTSIELFPGKYKFRAKKHHTAQYKKLEILTSGTSKIVTFQTATYAGHVKKHDGSDFAGIEVEYNDYSNHYMDFSPKYTGSNGKTSIELFPGKYKFRAKKHHTAQYKQLEILTSGTTKTVEFQTALAVGEVIDCDLNAPVSGIQVEYNDYSNHYMDLSPKYTGADGKASIELFPGTYKLRAKNHHTAQYKQINLTYPSTTVQFNPVRLCFTFNGTVKYNDYSNHWMNVPCNTYLFPGNYKFSFDGKKINLPISGCTVGSFAVVHMEESDGTPIQGDNVWWYYYPTSGHAGTTDANGDCLVILPQPKTSVKFTVKDKGFIQAKTQNIATNPWVNFQTVNVTMKLQDHDGDGTTDDLTGNEANGLKVYDYPHTETFGSGTTSGYTESMELLPLTYKFTLKYEGIHNYITQNVGLNNTVVFRTKEVTCKLVDHTGGTSLLAGNATGMKYYEYPYSGTFADGDLTAAESFTDKMDLLPETYKFTAKYKGVHQQRTQNISTNPVVTFQTKGYEVSLVDHAGGTSNLSGDATNVTYYEYPHTGTFGDGDLKAADNYKETMELFDDTYKFTVKYQNHKNSKTSSGDVQFQTGRVYDNSSGQQCYKYYDYPNSGAFSQNMELLPETYKFYFTGLSNMNFEVKAGKTLTMPNSPGYAKESITQQFEFDNKAADHLNTSCTPNPFSDELRIEYTLPYDSDVEIEVRRVDGKLVKKLTNVQTTKGTHTVTWNGNYESGFPAENGVYLFIIKAGEFNTMTKATLQK